MLYEMPQPLQPPTPKQREILVLASYGLSIRATAHYLGTSVSTVKNHRYALCKRLGCTSVLQSFRMCLEQGWIELN